MRILAIYLVILSSMQACQENKFRGRSEKTVIPACQNETSRVGVDLLLVIDNSGSNSETDCPGARQIGRDATGPRWECSAATNRERAVLQSYDLLSDAVIEDQDASHSHFAVVSFPSEADTLSGFDIRTRDWLSVERQERTDLESSLAFTRRPAGMTPYGGGLRGGHRILEQLPESDRAKVVMLITDGEPTDEAPSEVVRFVNDQLRSEVDKIVTVMVTGDMVSAQRQRQHQSFLTQRNYDQDVIDQLLGLNGEAGLVERISDQRIEVADSSELSSVLQDVIMENVGCEKQ